DDHAMASHPHSLHDALPFSSLAISFSELGEGMKTLAVDGETLWAEGRAERIAESDERAVRLVSCGSSFPEHEIAAFPPEDDVGRSEEHTSELQSREKLVCRL